MVIKSAAVLTIFQPGTLTKHGWADIAAWLRRQARHLMRDGHGYSPTRFTARYLYRMGRSEA